MRLNSLFQEGGHVQRQGDGTMSTVAFGRQYGQTSAIPAADTLHGFGDMDYPVL